MKKRQTAGSAGKGARAAERAVSQFERLARSQLKIRDPLRRNRRALGRGLVKAYVAARQSGNDALLGRVTSVTVPLLRTLPLFTGEARNWLDMMGSKQGNLRRCKNRCKRFYPPGVGRSICRANCYAYYYFCEF
jgi:hypothetical protein